MLVEEDIPFDAKFGKMDFETQSVCSLHSNNQLRNWAGHVKLNGLKTYLSDAGVNTDLVSEEDWLSKSTNGEV